ncbi:MAG: BNR repeat-containing protein [Thermoguttaceae bacterium]
MRMSPASCLSLVVSLLALGAARADEPPCPWRLAESVDVAPAWSGHTVGFALLTDGQDQFVACYDAQRRLTVCSRRLDSINWTARVLPTSVGWDSHNYVTMALDSQGQLHVSGNMHCAPLVYFRTTAARDVTTLRQVESMVGDREDRCTYPRFLTGARGELIFTYRVGSSGNGDQIWNVYDPKSQAWKRLFDSPLFSGEGLMNAYFVGPVQGNDGMFHVCWVWRDTGDCATNHDLCYARSRDLVHWEKSDGSPLTLPITLGSAEVVDPVPAGGGIINGNTRIGFDASGRVILSYHKHDAAGKTQVYNARRDEAGWKIVQATDWDYRWDFQGGGTIVFEIHVGAVSATDDGKLIQSVSHARRRGGRWILDPETLKPIGPAPNEPGYPASLARVESKFPGMEIRRAEDLAKTDDDHLRYVLQWETRPANRDRPYPGDPPPPTMLRVHKLLRD